MIEITQRIQGEDMTRGLAPKDLGFGSRHAVELLNLKPEREGLRGYTPLHDPFEGGVSLNFPFPQAFETPSELLLFRETEVQTITETTQPWGVSSISTYDPSSPATKKSISAGDSWQFANFQKSWYATNGSCLVFRTGLDPLSSGSDPKTFVGDQVTMNTVAAHKGRVFMGGFSSDLWESTFESFFSDWQTQLNNLNLDPGYGEIGSNWIAHSSIGGGDLPMWLFHPSGYATDLAPTKDRVLDRFERNEIGFLPLNTKSDVRNIKPLGDNLVAYCDEAVFLIRLEFPRAEQPATVGSRKLLDVGILDRGAVAGDEFGHDFIDQFGMLWRINADGQPQELGYRNQFEGKLGKTCLMYRSRHNKYTYISFPSSGFLLTENGLCEIAESPTFLLERGRKDHATSVHHQVEDALFVGPPLDFQDKGRKTATSVSLGFSGSSSAKCAFDFRFEPGGTWKRTDFQRVNNRGISYIRQAGGAFRPVIKANDPANFDLDYIEVRFQYSDARHQRGPRAGEVDS